MSNLLRFTARFSVLGGERVPLVTTSSAPSKTSSDPTSTPLKPAETQSLTPTNETATQDDSSDAAGLATTSAVALMVPIWIGLLF
jgi:cytoskeletal protein RodZ